MVRERVGAVLVAAGRSTRTGFDKLWAELENRPVVDWSLQAIAASRAVDRLVLVVARERLADAALLIAPYELAAMAVPGGGGPPWPPCRSATRSSGFAARR